ncbi:zinc-binding alcohol dehydrogenase family protein [Streptomyces cocklensis]|jgi:NADPH2:quinone reductase|uniref:NADPH2:quinone reductase n=1 Tax=Actinacidiphila cocklensis TaxID=887465 RepID=A0A9W4E201_9ACTN|nr:zinc-binding alcohol dehydrogenase family protein [Actinacidiphila cocklensis]MDD1061694.1 zinc-binding alcohol dehydrogenase family protein [Actinacidiphila cocklensis]WSX77728.1 zinc-binding alcohol dehydrogenase family protein [Streptomyces sp. NBC_00899]CAG6399482.1 NADPH2:quinone reductase [Actinacidiphila cocklensis]
MKAVVLDGVGQYRVEDVPEPVPGAGEVAVRVAYAGVQWGDVLVRDGHIPLARPFVPGFEAAGRIVAVGEGVAPERVGEEVVALVEGGACAEVVVAPAVLALGVGAAPLRDAAGLGWAGPAAYDLVERVGRVREGERVLIHAAAGGVGTLAAQFARAAGAATVVGVVGSAVRAAYAEGFGYDRVVTRDVFPGALGDDRFDVVLDPVGGATRTANVALLAPHGRLAVYGNLAGHASVDVSVDELLMRGVSVLGYNSALLSRTHPGRLAASGVHVLGLVAAGAVRVGLGPELPLDGVAAAVARLAAGAAAPGKTLLRVS